MNIVIANRQRLKRINSHFLRSVVAELIVELQLTEVELGISIVGAREMALVNETFLQHEGATDVITFDHAEKLKTEGRKQRKVHGELFVCVAVAMTQAKEFRTTWQAEVVRYVVHGVLHLLGYDDLKPHLRRVMKREENRLMCRLENRFSFTQLSLRRKT